MTRHILDRGITLDDNESYHFFKEEWYSCGGAYPMFDVIEQFDYSGVRYDTDEITVVPSELL